jgi:hypothetical protein
MAQVHLLHKAEIIHRIQEIWITSWWMEKDIRCIASYPFHNQGAVH